MPLVRRLGDITSPDFAPLLLAAVKSLTEEAGEPFPSHRRELERLIERCEEALRTFVADHRVQTNEVQRSWVLVPCFLAAARTASPPVLDLVELGTSAGLNLGADLYHYSYACGHWGDANSPLRLAGLERAPIPREILRLTPTVRARIGIDANPLDVRDPDSFRLLRAFTWPDEPERVSRLSTAAGLIGNARLDLRRGDWRDMLPIIARRRSREALMVVFEIASLGYAGADEDDRVRRLLLCATQSGPGRIAFLHSPLLLEKEPQFELRLELLCGGRVETAVALARADIHGEWIEWREAAAVE